MSAETAIVCKLTNFRPHPNADKLQLCDVSHYQICTSLDATPDAMGVFFSSEVKLSPEMLAANDLVPRKDPETGLKIGGGYFPENGRVRVQRFRGERSEGYWCPLNDLAWTGADLSKLAEGDKFTSLNGKVVCEKYYTAATLKAMRHTNQQGKKREYPQFVLHKDTEQYRHVRDEIYTDSVVWISEKIHGTSGRFGYLNTPIEARSWRTLWRKRSYDSWEHLVGTRRTVVQDGKVGYYGSEQFRKDLVAPLEGKLHKGETLYFEIVGRTETKAPLMGKHDMTKLKDKNLVRQYGNTIEYTYGTNLVAGAETAECKMYVYRITQIQEFDNDCFDHIELSWPQVKARCLDLNIKYVPELHGPIVIQSPKDKSLNQLDELINAELELPSTLDPRHIREGVVLRVDSPKGTTNWVKQKSWTFRVLEGIEKEKADFVDLEEIS